MVKLLSFIIPALLAFSGVETAAKPPTPIEKVEIRDRAFYVNGKPFFPVSPRIVILITTS